jgi:hypothetical protein
VNVFIKCTFCYFTNHHLQYSAKVFVLSIPSVFQNRSHEEENRIHTQISHSTKYKSITSNSRSCLPSSQPNRNIVLSSISTNYLVIKSILSYSSHRCLSSSSRLDDLRFSARCLRIDLRFFTRLIQRLFDDQSIISSTSLRKNYFII